jgi:UDP-glucose 4-epimerase
MTESVISAAMDCLVTGGAGFIGSNLVDALVERGDRVTVIDNLSTGKRENLAGALQNGTVLHTVNVQDAATVAAVFAAAQPEVVFHLAAYADVRFSVAHPFDDATTNVLGMINVLDQARSHGVRRVVYSSTGGGLYGEADVLPTQGYCHVYARLHGLSTVTVRYSNVYGPRQDIHGEGGVVAIFCGCLVEGRQPTVFGDGRQTRDWVEVDDVVTANLLAAESVDTGPLNIGREEETSVLDLLSALREVGGSRSLPDPKFAPERPGEVRRSCLDISQAKRELGWEPKVGLRDGLRAVLAGL